MPESIKLEIQVTKRDIEKGERLKSQSCMVALALKRMVKPKFKNEVEVSGHIAVIGNAKIGNITIKLPRNVQRKIENFDSQIKVRPFSFIVSLAPEQKTFFRIPKNHAPS